MTTLAAATKAARVYRETEKVLAPLKDTIAANKAAKETLGIYMIDKGLDLFRGVTLKVVPFSGWDSERLHALLANPSDFRRLIDRKYFGLASRPKHAKPAKP